MVEGHSIWQFQADDFKADDRESYPKAIRVPVNPRREIAGNCCTHTARRLCGLAGLSATADRQAPPSVLSLEDGAFQGCYVLREVVAPGCVQYSRRVFAERCSLSRVGVLADRRRQQCPCTRGAAGPICFRELSHAYIHHLCNGPNQQV